MFGEEDEPLFFKCRACGQSMDTEEAVWIVNIKWPAKIMVNSDGQMNYMLAKLEDKDIINHVDMSEIVCDSCQSSDIEVKEWDNTPDWAKKAKEKKDDPKSTKDDAEDK